jgi:hypothetical protein
MERPKPIMSKDAHATSNIVYALKPNVLTHSHGDYNAPSPEPKPKPKNPYITRCSPKKLPRTWRHVRGDLWKAPEARNPD